MTDEDQGPITLGEIRAGRSLAERVTALEQREPAAAGAAAPAADPSYLEWLDRHRADIDELKRRYNQLARYVKEQLEGTGE